MHYQILKYPYLLNILFYLLYHLFFKYFTFSFSIRIYILLIHSIFSKIERIQYLISPFSISFFNFVKPSLINLSSLKSIYFIKTSIGSKSNKDSSSVS